MDKIDTQGMSGPSDPNYKGPVTKHKPMVVIPRRLFSPEYVKEMKILINEVLDERDALEEQKEVLMEEKETTAELTAERDALDSRLENFWVDEDENQIRSQWMKAAAKFQSELVTIDF